MLFKHCGCAEEGTRNVVAECLGKLTLIDPPNLLPKLKGHLESGSPLARSTVVTAMKFTISDQVGYGTCSDVVCLFFLAPLVAVSRNFVFLTFM